MRQFTVLEKPCRAKPSQAATIHPRLVPNSCGPLQGGGQPGTGATTPAVSTGSTDRPDFALVVSQIHILPSASSIGYTVSFYAKLGEPDGWCPEAYGHVRGIARLPESTGTQAQRAWQAAVVRRLRWQGVKLLPGTDADAYERTWGRLWSLVWKTPILRYLVLN